MLEYYTFGYYSLQREVRASTQRPQIPFSQKLAPMQPSTGSSYLETKKTKGTSLR